MIKMYYIRLEKNTSTKQDRLVRNISFFYKRESSSLGSEFDVLTASHLHVARVLTLIDHGLFKAIPSHEFIKLNFQSNERAPSFSEMATRFNQVGLWVATETVTRLDVTERAGVLSFFINVAYECYELKNFNTCFAIVAGLNNAAVSRLAKTWEKVPKKVRQRYEVLERLFEMTNNFASYRTAYHLAQLPKVPYLMIFPKDLIGIEENNPTTIQPDDKKTEMINFTKMRLLWNVFSDIRRTQQAVYPFKNIPKLHVKIMNVTIIDEDKELYALSLEREPRAQSNPASSSNNNNEQT